MKGFILTCIVFAFHSFAAFCQVLTQPTQAITIPSYNESLYTIQAGQGYAAELSGKFYVVSYRKALDSITTLKAIYRDSTKAVLILKRFYKGEIAEGPFFHYSNGSLAVKGEYKNGKLNGERLTYRNGIVVQKANFENGKKKGVWQEFTPQGQLKRTITYDLQQNIQSIQLATQSTSTQGQ